MRIRQTRLALATAVAVFFYCLFLGSIGPAAAATDSPELRTAEGAFVAAAIIWPIAIVAIVWLSVPVLHGLVAHLNDRLAQQKEEYERQSRASWSSSDSVNTTETVAMVVAAAVAARLIKAKGNIQNILDYEKLRSIVRRMSQSINVGEARALEGRSVAWVHKDHLEDYYEQRALENLGAHVRFCKNNESLLKYVQEEGKENVVAIVSNCHHWLTAADEKKRVDATDEAASELLDQIRTLKSSKKLRSSMPVFVYSRWVADHPEHEALLLEKDANLCTEIPEEIIHRILVAAANWERKRSQTTPADDKEVEAPA